MGRTPRLSDHELDRLLAGKEPSGDGDLEELAAFIREARALLEEPPAAETAARHIAAIVEAAEFSERQETRAGVLPDRRRPTQPTSRRKLMQRNPLSVLRMKLAVAVAAGLLLLAAFGGAAYGGALPGPVQDTVAGVAGTLGVSLPSSDDENDLDEGDVSDLDEGDQADIDEGDKSDVDEGDQADVEQGPQNDVQEEPQGDVDDGAQNDVQEEPQGDVDDGAQNDVQEEPQGDVDDGAQNDVQKGPQDDVDEGQQEDVDERGDGAGQSGSQGNSTDGDDQDD